MASLARRCVRGFRRSGPTRRTARRPISLPGASSPLAYRLDRCRRWPNRASTRSLLREKRALGHRSDGAERSPACLRAPRPSCSRRGARSTGFRPFPSPRTGGHLLARHASRRQRVPGECMSRTRTLGKGGPCCGRRCRGHLCMWLHPLRQQLRPCGPGSR